MGLKSKATPKNRIQTKKKFGPEVVNTFDAVTSILVMFSQNRGPLTFLVITWVKFFGIN